MDDLAFGRLIRLARVRRGWTQAELAATAGLSSSQVSRLERGAVEGSSLRTLRAICRPLDIRLDLLPRARGADVDRLLAADHSAMAEAAVPWVASFDGWQVRPEVSFSWYGERGVVDLVGWHEQRQAMLLVELKTEIVDVGALLGTVDRRHRLAQRIGEGLGWQPAIVGSLVLVAESDANRRRVARHAALFGAALPARVVGVRGWLREPAGDLRGLMFFANSRPRGAHDDFVGRRRARRAPNGGIGR